MLELNLRDAKPVLKRLRELERATYALADREQSGTSANTWDAVTRGVRDVRVRLVRDLLNERAYWRRVAKRDLLELLKEQGADEIDLKGGNDGT